MQGKNYATSSKKQHQRLASDDPFWPRIDLAEVRKNLVLASHVSDARLQVAAQVATQKAAGEFAQWRRVLRARGYKRLEDLTAHHRLSRCYRRAVEAYANQALAHDVQVVERPSGWKGDHVYE